MRKKMKRTISTSAIIYTICGAVFVVAVLYVVYQSYGVEFLRQRALRDSEKQTKIQKMFDSVKSSDNIKDEDVKKAFKSIITASSTVKSSDIKKMFNSIK